MKLTRFWHRRICEATMFISAAVIALYLLPYYFIPGVISEQLLITWSSLILSAITFTISFILYLWAPKKRVSLWAFGVYLLLVVTTGNLVISTGETGSPFIALWIVAGVFSGVFGLRGYTLVFGATLAYVLYSYINQVPASVLIVASIAGFGPLIASFIIWHTKSTKDEDRDKAYNQLASELSQEANKSDAVINAINDGVVSVDKQGVIQLINPAAQRIIGWGQNDAVGLSYKSVVKLNDRADKPLTVSNDPVEKVLATSQEVHSEDFSVTTEAGKKVLLSLIVSPIGQPSTGAIMVFRDMTKEKAEEREQAEFISTASHEMRTPVASIEGYLGLVLNPATATIDEKARDYVQKAQASAQHLGRLFQDLLDVSKAEDGRMTNDPGVLDVIEFVGDVAEGLRPKAVEKGLRFLYKPQPEEEQTPNDRVVTPVYYAYLDNDHLREVVANLVENAIKYTPKGDVIIDVTGDETHITISVQDSGIGIPTEDIPHLFQKFYRVDNTDTREIGGTGLGLYLCRRLTEVMGGKMRVESEYKKGSTFFVDLPRLDHQEAQRLMEAATIAEDMIGEASLATEESAPAVTPAPAIAAPVAPPPPPVIAPVQQPLPQPAAEVAEQPVVATQVPPSPPSVAQPTPQAPAMPINTPLSQIEQNPSAYVSGRAPLQIPVRSPEETNQP